MTAPINIRRKLEQFDGLDLFHSELTRDFFSASEFLNGQFVLRRSLALTKRKGNKIVTHTRQIKGIYEYVYIDKSTGLSVSEIVGVGDLLYRKVGGSLNLTYVPATSASVLFFFVADPVTSTYHAVLSVDGVDVLDIDVGTGEEGSPVTLSSLASSISAHADFLATVTGTSSLPAAILEIRENQTFSSGSFVTVFSEWEAISSSFASPPFSSFLGSDTENASFAILADVLYIATGSQELAKYDGLTLSRAGMPKGIIVSAVGSTGSSLSGRFDYKITYERKDHQRNIIEGDVSSVTSVDTTAAAKDIDVNVTPLATDGYKTNSGQITSTQSGVTVIGSLTGHSLEIGDTAYFLDRSTSEYTEREVLAVTSSAVTIDGAVVDVDINDFISANIRINIWRTTDLELNPGSEFYLAATIPGHSPASPQTYTDTISDSDIVNNAVFIEPIKIPALPPKGSQIESHQGGLVLTGVTDSPNSIFYSDTNPENFPALNSFEILGKFGGDVKGLGSLESALVAFKRNGVAFISGDLFLDSFRVDFLSEGDIGCESPGSIVKTPLGLLFLSPTGFYSVTHQGQVLNIGQAIQPAFSPSETISLETSKAQAVLDPFNDMYICFTANLVSGDPSAESVTWMLDVRQERLSQQKLAWVKWKSLNMAGGALVDSAGTLFFHSKVPTNTGRLLMRHEFDSVQAYADKLSGIDFIFKDQWDSAGDPSVFKQMGILKLYSLHPNISPSFTLDFVAERDFTSGLVHTSKTFSFGTPGAFGGYGGDAYGSSPYGSPSSRSLKAKLKTNKVEAIRFSFSNSNILENVLISGYEYEMSAPFRKKIKQ